MKQRSVDFASRSLLRSLYLINGSRAVWVGGALLLLLLLWWLGEWMMLKQDSLVSETEKLQRVLANQSSPAGKSNPKTSLDALQRVAVQQAIRQLNLPWGEMLDVLEHVTPATIALLELTPDVSGNRFKGVAEAKTSAHMLRYIQVLKSQAAFTEVRLLGHEINEEDANKPYRFSFELIWRGAQP